jgi:hypothetical protein
LATFVGSQTPKGQKFWQNAKRTYEYSKNNKLRKNIRSKLGNVSVVTPAGICLGETPAISFKAQDIRPVIEKITRGLFYHHSGTILASDAKIEILEIKQSSPVNPGTGFNNDVFEMCAPHMKTGIIGDEFCYKFGIAEDAENCSMAFYQFYNSFFVTVITLDKHYSEGSDGTNKQSQP